DFFIAHKFDKSEIKDYSVLLSIPDSHDSNYIEIIDQNNNKTIYTSLGADKRGSDSLGAFCAYSPNIDIKNSVIFVNYGRLGDYQILSNVYNITRDTIAGKILIAKQFHLTADEQMSFAHQMGAAALLLYPDPEHYNPPSLGLKPFPSSQYMPSDAIRHDSLIWNGLGDPQTPGYAATSYAHRLPLQSLHLPSIPVQPISFENALQILSRLDGSKAPKAWNNGSNTTYNLGPVINFRTPLVIHISTKSLKAILRDGRVINMSYESQELRYLLLNQVSQHQVFAIQALAKPMGWRVLSLNINVGVGHVEPIGTASSIVLVSPNGDRIIAIRCGPHSGIEVKMCSSPQEFYASALVRDRKWQNLTGSYREVDWERIEGKNFINKIEYLMASLANY
ncbi:unnamed protein product, partial [Medioppia subpectinata]